MKKSKWMRNNTLFAAEWMSGKTFYPSILDHSWGTDLPFSDSCVLDYIKLLNAFALGFLIPNLFKKYFTLFSECFMLFKRWLRD